METVLWARSDSSAQRARKKVGDGAEVLTDLSEMAGRSTVVVEAVAEDADVKGELLARIHAELAPDGLLATTTSSLSVGELAVASGRPERFAGLHVFNPVQKMDLVELAFPDQAVPDTRERMHALCDSIGKTAVEVPCVPGFVVNRLLFPFLFDAVRLMDETGLEPAAIDDCMRMGAGHPMGPLALLDYVGLDVAVAIGRSIGADVPLQLESLVAKGATGKKAGRGFYAY
jgi:3-hydroxybutyryl-CoA dehydrogenase